MRNDLEGSATTGTAPPAPGRGTTDRTRSRGALVGRIARGALLVAVLVLVLFLLLGQLLAVLPVSWWSPFLHVLPIEIPLLVVGIARDVLGSWSLLPAALALAAGVFSLRRRGRRRLPLALSAISATALLLALATTTVQVVSVHGATGQWFLFSPATPASAVGRGPDKTVTYATLGGERMKADLYLPEAASATAVPLVVSIHGGGFISGSRGPTVYTSWLADHGYAVLDVDYRLATATQHTWNTADADVGCALTWATAHAAEYGWDMDRVATFGGSAGGNLAVNVAYKANAGTLEPSCGAAGQLPQVKAAIAAYPVVDLSTSVGESAYGAESGDWYVGGDPARYPERYKAVDSANQISKDAPPTLILQGSRDHLVFADHTKAFADKLTTAGITHRYVELPFLDHAYDSVSAGIGTKATRALTLPWLQEYIGG
ncbi:alpha/beta hydrolase fold domain-containing protein [Streptomyces sp. NPDC058683]|uniref:alpha/beta hydrolase fold domain-containing protein n=1 Tax=Streptomyces sp. NPDC058683 TaxID=3346597 RepID=UPI00366A36C0